LYKKYNYYDSKDMNKEVLTKDLSFLGDASAMLEERAGFTDEELDTPDKVYDAYMEHFRISDVNEVTAVKDLTHVMRGTTDQKARYGRLLDLYEKSEGESFFEDVGTGVRKLGDYAQGLATAPSTIASVFTGGFSKIAAQGGVQATKIGIKKILGEVMKAGVKGALIEGGVGLGQGTVKESTRLQSGIKKEFDYSRPFIEGGLSATGGFVLTGLARGITLPSEIKSLKLAERAEGAVKLKETEAKVLTDKVLENADIDKVKKINSNLDEVTELLEVGLKAGKKKALDPTKVKEGQKIKKDIFGSDSFTSSLSNEVRNNITAAVLRVGDKVNQKPGERITTAIHRAILKDDVPIDDISKILDEHNITLDQFSLVYKADVSDAGRLLQKQSFLQQTIGSKSTKTANKADRKVVKSLLEDIDALNRKGVSKVSAEETAQELAKNPLVMGYKLFQDIDSARVSLMTIQPKTTARNTINGGFRILTDSITRTMDNTIENALQLRYGFKGEYKNFFDGSTDVAKFMFNPYEGDIIRKVFSESFPNEAKRLFFANADIAARAGGDGFMTAMGRKLNFLNTASDNIFKRAVLGASLQRGIRDAGITIEKAAKERIIKQRLIQRLGPDYRASADYTKTVTLLSKQLDKQKTHDLFTMFEAGDFTKIPDDIFTKAVKQSYDFAYQTQFKEYGKLGSDVARGVISASRKIPFLITSFLPFPKFVASQLKFIYEHAPVLGMLPAEKIPNPFSPIKAKKVEYNFKDRLAKQFTTAAVTTVAYQWRAKQGETNHWYEYRGNDGKLVDGRAMYGPFSMFMLYADILYRSGVFNKDRPNTLPTKSWGRYAKDVLQAVGGSTFRTGLGLYTLDKLLTDLSNTEGEGGEKTDKILGEIIGNVVKTVTIPIAPFRDLYSQFDVKSSYVPETKTGETNMFSIIEARAMSNFPDLGEDTPFIGKKGFMSNKAVSESLDLQYDEPARSAFETGPLQYQDPLIGQFTGEMRRKPKNLYLQELGKLNMQNYEIYRKHPNAKVDKLTRFYLSEVGSATNLNERMAQVIRSDKYKKKSYKEKRSSLYTDSMTLIGLARKKALGEIKATEPNKGARYTTIDFQKWESLNQRDKESVNELLKRELKNFGFNDFTSVNADKDRMVRIKDKEVSILILANRAAKIVQKGVLSGNK